MRTFKPTYKDKNGKTREVEKWWIETRDHLGKIRRFAGYTDEKQTEKLGEKIDKLIIHRKNSEPPDSKLTDWLVSIESKLRERLVEVGILTPDRANIGKPFSENIDDYKKSLTARNRSEQHIKETISAIKHIAADCHFGYWTDITAAKVENYLKRLRDKEKGISYRRSNALLTALKMFANWMIQAGRAGESPIRYLKSLNVAKTPRHQRRALSPDDMRNLLEVARQQPTRYGMTGQERALLYRLAAETGLRVNELRSLKVSSFDFENLSVKVLAAYTKNSKECSQDLRRATAIELKQFFAGKLPNVKAFGGTYGKLTDKTADMIKEDLEAAEIAYVDESGQFADFHALRHTTASLLAAGGVRPKDAQDVMRHSDINLTMNTYTHTLTGQTRAVDSLPDLYLPSKKSQELKATGTDGKLGGNLGV